MSEIINEISNGLKELRNAKPLVVNITNFVVMNVTANALLALGASPAMAHHPEDVNELAQICGALVLNPGTPDDTLVDAMIGAGKSANSKNKPVILDPVAAGATKYRTRINEKILDEVDVAVVRGNASEIMALTEKNVSGKGVDSLHTSDIAIEHAKNLSLKYNVITAVSGMTDYITDGKKVYSVKGGDILLTYITGSGCTLSSLTGAFSSIIKDPLKAAISSHVIMKVCSEMAVKKADYPGSFQTIFLDCLYKVREKELKRFGKIEEI